MRILSKAFIEGQPQQQTPAKLEIVGIEEDLKEMFGSDYSKLADLQQSVTLPAISESDFDAEDSND